MVPLMVLDHEYIGFHPRSATLTNYYGWKWHLWPMLRLRGICSLTPCLFYFRPNLFRFTIISEVCSKNKPPPPGNRLQDRRDVADPDLWYPPLGRGELGLGYLVPQS